MEDNKRDEIDLLREMEKSPIISQRDLAKATGMSLGMVNILIKKCVKTGLIKIEQLNSRTMKYILTPKGINEKAKKTLRYVKNSYKFMIEMTNKISILIKKDIEANKKIAILGENDEIQHILLEIIKKNEVDYLLINSPNSIKEKKKEYTIYIWDVGLEKELKGYNYVNILK